MNSTRPDISIIVPVFNRSTIVTDTLDSIAAQTERPLALIIVDNNSTDDSLAVVTKWAVRHEAPDFSVTVLSETTPGAPAARNKGFESVTTPYVMFFDSDDIMSPNHVKDFADTFRADPQLDIAGRDIVSIELDGTKKIHRFADRDMMFRHAFNAILSTQRYAVKSSFLREAGGWNPDALAWNDFELGFRLLVKHPKCKKIDDTVSVTMRRLSESITGTSYSATPQKWEHSLDLVADTLSNAGYPDDAIELRRVVLAAIYSREGSPEGKRLLGEVMARQKSASRRALYSVAYHYTRKGGRGIHILLRPFMKFFKDV